MCERHWGGTAGPEMDFTPEALSKNLEQTCIQSMEVYPVDQDGQRFEGFQHKKLNKRLEDMQARNG